MSKQPTPTQPPRRSGRLRDLTQAEATGSTGNQEGRSPKRRRTQKQKTPPGESGGIQNVPQQTTDASPSPLTTTPSQATSSLTDPEATSEEDPSEEQGTSPLTNPEEATSEEDPSEETDPARVRQPDSTVVHKNLRTAWAINSALLMCFIFDAISPARRFKRGMAHNDNVPYPEYNDEESGNVTETDGIPHMLMQYMPPTYL